jgi:hypothetical protein
VDKDNEQRISELEDRIKGRMNLISTLQKQIMYTRDLDVSKFNIRTPEQIKIDRRDKSINIILE